MANFLSATANYEDYSTRASANINSHVLRNNESGLKKTFNFFQGDAKILLLNGFAGVGKKQIADHTLSYVDKNTIILKYVCTESSKLDDIHLTFLDTLKKKTSLKSSAELDAISAINDKIDYIITKLDLNYIIVLYNFDNIKEENRQDILNYIFAMSEKSNIKTVIVSRVFDSDVIPKKIKYVKVMVKALSKLLMETYMKEFGIKVTPQMSEQFYRLSRGYFFSVCIAIKIMINQGYALNDLIVQYTNSGLKFDDFLAQTYYRLIVGTTKSAFNLFVKLHHGLNLKILQTIGSYPETIFKTLSDNYYIYKKDGLYYPSEYLKLQLAPIIGDEITKKYLIAYYEKQIELPPEERDFIISRASLQDEIAFYKNINIPPKEKPEAPKEEAKPAETAPAKPKEDWSNLSVMDLLNKAAEAFGKYDYIKTVEILTSVLSRKEELIKEDKLFLVYGILAQTYDALQKWKYALYYYDMLEKHYTELEKKDSVQMVQLEKAHIYYKSYRIIDSIKLLKMLTANSKNKSILSKCNILLGNIALSASNKELAKQYYKEGVQEIDENTENPIKMELYFKYAVLSDEKNDINDAVEYYQKCISINEPTCKYKALAYSNLADLFYDNDLYEEAKECYENAYSSDKVNNNAYGMYYALSKIIELTDKREKDKLLQMAIEAKSLATKSQDYNAMVDATIKLGDVYYDFPDPENALKQYLELYRLDRAEFGEENFQKVKSRLDDIKVRLGDERFEELVPNYE